MNIAERLLRLERLIICATKEVLDTDECAMYLRVTPDRVRHMVYEREIPCFKYKGKNYYLKSELDAIRTQEKNRQLTIKELKEKAERV